MSKKPKLLFCSRYFALWLKIDVKSNVFKNSSFYCDILTLFQTTSVFIIKRSPNKPKCFTVCLKTDQTLDSLLLKHIITHKCLQWHLQHVLVSVSKTQFLRYFVTHGQAKTYLCSKTFIFTMNCEPLFKNTSFYSELWAYCNSSLVAVWSGWLGWLPDFPRPIHINFL